MRRSSPAPLAGASAGRRRKMRSILVGASPAPCSWRSALVPAGAHNEIKDFESSVWQSHLHTLIFLKYSILNKFGYIALRFLACCQGVPGLGGHFVITLQRPPMGGMPGALHVGRNSSPSGKVFILVLQVFCLFQLLSIT